MRLKTVALLGLLLLSVVRPAGLNGETLRVPGQFELVTALHRAAYGDTVLVSPGRYKLQAKLGSGISLVSTDGPDSTVLWNQRWYVLKLNDCDLATAVSGFKFEGKGCNVAIACTTGAPSIVGNVIADSWDGINLYQCNALIKGNTITGCNRAIQLDYCDPEILECEFRGNGDAVSITSGGPVIARCTFEHNGRAILILGHSYPVIGGSLDTANDILTNSYTIYNAGLQVDGTQFTDRREIAVATHNYWGSECPNVKRFRGEVIYTPWTNAAHDTLLRVCPEQPD
jgi:hypothetical protein